MDWQGCHYKYGNKWYRAVDGCGRQKEMSVDLQAQPHLPGQVSASALVQPLHPGGF